MAKSYTLTQIEDHIPREEWLDIKHWCERRGESINLIIIKALAAWWAKEKKKNV